MQEQPFLSLSELNLEIRAVLEAAMPDEYWVTAEVAEISPPRNRHRYLQLVEKTDDGVVAQARATIWASRAFLVEEFEEATCESLKPGMEVLLKVRVRYHEVYGLSLDILNIDPTYSLGGLAKRKRETLDRLAREGLLTLNSSLELPLAPQRVAVISSASAAGLSDFILHLEKNPHGFRFTYALFPAAVQGADAEESIAAALADVSTCAHLFDVAVLVRGGGSQVDLSCFDCYGVAAAIARCPIPVITGIGHEKDETVADMAAHTRVKTPTAAAELLIGAVLEVDCRLAELLEDTMAAVRERQRRDRLELQSLAQRLATIVCGRVAGQERGIDRAGWRLAEQVERQLCGQEVRIAAARARMAAVTPERLAREDERCARASADMSAHARERLASADSMLSQSERALRHLDPREVLRRGYSITRVAGRIVREASELSAGDEIHTELLCGSVLSRVDAVMQDEGEAGPSTPNAQRLTPIQEIDRGG